MTLLHRRSFVKMILATAASGSPVCAGFNAAVSIPTSADTSSSSSTILESGGQQLHLSPAGTPLTFQNFLFVEGEWKPATLPGVQLVTGASFPLMTSHVRREGQRIICEGTAAADSLDGKRFAYEWSAEISALAISHAEPWFRFRTTLHLPKPIRLHQDGKIEPQIITWLNSTSTLMEGQSGSWRRVALTQPTRNSLGTYGNDLPAVYISNDFVRKPNERSDSWYPFENGLVKYPAIGSLAGSKEITDHFLEAFQTAPKMARQYDYLFPIHYQVSTLLAEGAGTNYAIGGLYAWAAILAHRLTAEEHYREEARRAIQVLYTVPADRLFHEPQELAYGALAAAELGMRDQAHYLLYQQLRMFYWYSDPSQKSHDVRGMVQAAASILYPAFKENVEAVLPWTGILKRGIIFEGLLRFMDQQR